MRLASRSAYPCDRPPRARAQHRPPQTRQPRYTPCRPARRPRWTCCGVYARQHASPPTALHTEDCPTWSGCLGLNARNTTYCLLMLLMPPAAGMCEQLRTRQVEGRTPSIAPLHIWRPRWKTASSAHATRPDPAPDPGAPASAASRSGSPTNVTVRIRRRGSPHACGRCTGSSLPCGRAELTRLTHEVHMPLLVGSCCSERGFGDGPSCVAKYTRLPAGVPLAQSFLCSKLCGQACPAARLVRRRAGCARALAAQASTQGARLRQALHVGPVALLPRAGPPACDVHCWVRLHITACAALLRLSAGLFTCIGGSSCGGT